MSSEQQAPTQAFGVLADRVDGEPPAILGLTTSELLLVSVTTGLVLLPVLLATAFALDIGHGMLAATGFVFMGGVYVGSMIFRKLKRGHPMGHYQVKFAVLLQRLFGGNKFLLRSGYWSLGRTMSPRARSRG
jgi:conjugative transfer region protein (TIGR03750 family)